MERVIEVIIRSQISIDSMKFAFMPGRSTTDAIFVLRQLHEKHITKHKDLFFAFVDLEKAFGPVPRKVVCWGAPKVRYEVHFFLLFIIVLEASSQEYHLGCPWELLYADDLVISANSIVEITERLKLRKDNLEEKGLRVNMKKTKIMHSQCEASKSTDSSKWPCGVCSCSKGVGSNSILCSQCNQWIHKRCTNLKGRLRADPDFLSGALVTSIDNQATSIKVGDNDIEVVQSFCYLGDTISKRGDCFDATTARIRLRWFGHLHRMPNELWPKMVLSFEVAGSVPRGRPRKQWKENINKDLASKNLKIDDVFDRKKWERCINPGSLDPGKQCATLVERD
ncbi:uncharacterized protein LOC130613626 [Hydractinia symbiolongicarpus]|uniref:uncharacterized protein LOC130613626 n=1 Tax=Hydractinia symbiolongicarpus TaxID=13093 RepID=UPI00254D80B6|nr:uncharacterized protein LOC130613626 [Hydractinia symbiolongicarpus]